ncbi:MAG TPA: monovalent cation/H(+) antiporter subunit G [Baekduia sp.]|nr:monovalent cation/H(+) antiporter subunit G [Baekduia sp.]
MSVTDAIAGVLLVAGTAVQALACVGLLAGRDVFARIHLMAPAGVLGAPLICAAIVVNEGSTMGTTKAVITGAILAVTGPVLAHATARAVRLRATGHVAVLPSEAHAAREAPET